MIDFNKGIAGNKNQIFITNDSWINYKTIEVYDLQSLWINSNESISYVSNSEIVEYHWSNDKGLNWESVEISDFESTKLYFNDDNLGFIIGNIIDTVSNSTLYVDIIYRTSDGGKTWLEVLHNIRNERSELKDIDFKDSYKGIATGTSNSVYTTKDGGITWNKQIIEPLIGSPSRNTKCGYTNNKFIISVDHLGLYFIKVSSL